MEMFKKLWRVKEASELNGAYDSTFIKESCLAQLSIFDSSLATLLNEVTLIDETNVVFDNKNSKIRGYRILPTNPKTQLTIQDHRNYINYLQFSLKGAQRLNAEIKTSLANIQKIEPIIQEEKNAYSQFVKDRWTINGSKKCNFIQPQIEDSFQKQWEAHLNILEKYPQIYSEMKMIPLVYQEGTTFDLKETRIGVEMGKVSALRLLKKGRHYFKGSHQLSDHKQSSLKTVSCDHLAEQLAQQHNVDIVISSSGLKHLVDNHPPYSKFWNLPVKIKEYTLFEGGRKVTKKIIYIDKALPQNRMNNVQKNNLIFKKLLKSHLCSGIGYSYQNPMPLTIAEETVYTVDENKLLLTKCDKCLNEVENSNLLNEQILKSSNDLFAPKKNLYDSVDELIINHQSNGDKSVKKLNNLGDSFDTSDSDADSKCGDKLIIDIPEEDIEKADLEREQPIEKNSSSSEKEEIKTLDTIDKSENSDLKDIEKRRKLKTPPSIQRCLRSNALNSEKILRSSTQKRKCEVINTQIKKQRTNQRKERTNSLGISIRTENDVTETLCLNENQSTQVELNDSVEKKVFSSEKVQTSEETLSNECSQRNSCECEKLRNNRYEKLNKAKFSVNKTNVIYRVWTLSPAENYDNQITDVRKKHFNILIRCKLDACKKEGGVHQPFIIIPKLEYQLDYGAEVCTKSELCCQWISSHIRPGASVLRGRIDPENSELIKVDECCKAKIHSESTFLYNYKPNNGFSSLYSVLSELMTRNPGDYMLSHTPRYGPFVNLLAAVPDSSNATLILNDLKTFHTIEEHIFPWIPIDSTVLLPNNLNQSVIPGLFKGRPKDNQKSKKATLKIKPKSKKKKKKKQKKSKQKKQTQISLQQWQASSTIN